MRIIDADEVLKRWVLKFYAMGGDRLGPNGDEISFYVNGLLNEIQNAPTYERPTGHWEYVTHYCRRYRVCSECHAEKEDDRARGWNFCFNCGADMRGDRE